MFCYECRMEQLTTDFVGRTKTFLPYTNASRSCQLFRQGRANYVKIHIGSFIVVKPVARMRSEWSQICARRKLSHCGSSVKYKIELAHTFVQLHGLDYHHTPSQRRYLLDIRMSFFSSYIFLFQLQQQKQKLAPTTTTTKSASKRQWPTRKVNRHVLY